ncbi:hypothetical protein CDL15_Pgr002898 [Punica granatum]|uniref:Chaperone protein dnaJ C76, chloroplastic n=1 Tax=Punica granatum TaxID=22663 RepID=A0A218X136_PUNGR|nr:hypothetical protein CDL15_Pgr002898 [Punica granatum]
MGLPPQHLPSFHARNFSLLMNFPNNPIIFPPRSFVSVFPHHSYLFCSALLCSSIYIHTRAGQDRTGQGVDSLQSEFLLDAQMAQIMSPVCTEALKLQTPASNLNSRSPCRVFSRTSSISSLSMIGRCASRRASMRVRVATGDPGSVDSVADDYYAVLGLLPDATPDQIKKAYYNCMKACHPDLSGNDPETTNFCMFINEVYTVLSDPVQRMVYDEIHGYALTAINPFVDDSSPKDHVFVDEFSCIGCKNCANVASDVFSIEEDFGRARVYCQRGNPNLIQEAIDSCPVDCIHWTSAAQLSLLEDEMRRVERVNVALMLTGMGAAGADVFRMASSRWEKRQAKVLVRAIYFFLLQ